MVKDKATVMFKDDSFHANNQSIFFKTASNLSVNASQVVWKRPKALCKNPILHGHSVQSEPVQGALGNCWMVAPIYPLHNKGQLQKLFVDCTDFSESAYCGRFTCKLWDESTGSWVEITVDDRLPTVDEKLIFGCCTNPSEFWFAILEKACAKFFGCYEALSSGLASTGFMLFTGGYCWRKELSHTVPNIINTKRQIKQSLQSSKIHLFVCFDFSACDAFQGIASGHYYVLVKWMLVNNVEMVELFNPWNSNNDSTLSVSYEIMCTNCPTVTFAVCNLTAIHDNPTPWYKHEAIGGWVAGKTSGGNKTKASYYKNPQFVITHKGCSSGQLYMCLIQTHHRHFSKRKSLEQAIGLHVWSMQKQPDKKLPSGFLTTNSSSFCLAPDYQYKGDVALFCTHASDCICTIIIPSTLEADVSGKFLLRVCTTNKSLLEELPGT